MMAVSHKFATRDRTIHFGIKGQRKVTQWMAEKRKRQREKIQTFNSQVPLEIFNKRNDYCWTIFGVEEENKNFLKKGKKIKKEKRNW